MAAAAAAAADFGVGELQAVATLFKELKQGRPVSAGRDAQMTRAFETHVNGVLGLLDERLATLNNESDYLAREAEIALAKHGAYDVCFQSAIEMAAPDLVGPLRALCVAHAKLFQGLAQVARAFERDKNAEIEALRVEKERAEHEVNDLMEAARALDDEAEIRHEETMELRRRLGTRRQNAPAVDEAEVARKTTKIWTRNQLVDTIEALRESKAKHDRKCDEARVARDTMQQHMYAFLNQRYGLKTLIVDVAASIRKTAAEHAPADVEICAFVKVLENSLDEPFLEVLSTLKASIRRLLRAKLAVDMKRKSERQVEAALAARLADSPVREAEWQYIITDLYERADHKRVQALLRRKTEGDDGVNPGGGGARRALPYETLVQLLMSYQLAKQQRHLEPIVEGFKARDDDNDGVLTRDAFADLMRDASIWGRTKDEDEVLDVVAEADPYETGVVTFSSAAQSANADLIDALMARSAAKRRSGR
ncbi:hypothetical protein CTAYLR_006050 [Chrysophaeum taylorii]|uniref:EF-hand domain-containing protein n=1 Tax=Chrysophaeum taylorii TaxID=2483200 RepID=A0AAD7ULT9_9STRA|nr:hypothetical protein CTAYLR_006050 [Chrysophaeum taylorii]